MYTSFFPHVCTLSWKIILNLLASEAVYSQPLNPAMTSSLGTKNPLATVTMTIAIHSQCMPPPHYLCTVMHLIHYVASTSGQIKDSLCPLILCFFLPLILPPSSKKPFWWDCAGQAWSVQKGAVFQLTQWVCLHSERSLWWLVLYELHTS